MTLKVSNAVKGHLKLQLPAVTTSFLWVNPGAVSQCWQKEAWAFYPPLTPTQALETSMIKSIFGEL